MAELVDLPAGRQARKMYYVYVLYNPSSNIFYKGLTKNLEQRLKDHHTGKTYLKRYNGKHSLIHVEVCKSLKEARNIEKFLKSGYGREILKELLEINN